MDTTRRFVLPKSKKPYPFGPTQSKSSLNSNVYSSLSRKRGQLKNGMLIYNGIAYYFYSFSKYNKNRVILQLLLQSPQKQISRYQQLKDKHPHQFPPLSPK